MATTSSKGRHYAPPDPTLPRPWRALIDGSTGYIYFWNPVTKVTQYERPVAVADYPAPQEQEQQLAPTQEGDSTKDDGIFSRDNAPSSPVPLDEKPSSHEDDVIELVHDHGKNDAPCPRERADPSAHSEPEHSDDHISGSPSESNVPFSDDSSMLMQQSANNAHEAKEDDVNEDSLRSSGLHANEEEQQPSSLHEKKTELSTDPSNASSLSRSSKRSRYAAADPTLPKPWRALIDGNTGFIYFWNPETKATQYERPQAAPPLISYSQKAEPISEKQNWSQHDSVTKDQPGESSNKLNQDAPVGQDNVLNCSSPQVALSAELYRRKHEITIDGNAVLDPYMTFQSTGFPPEILKEVCGAGFSAPTPIQAQSWPFALKGRDIVAVAKTGSGKTLGYLIPGFILLKRLQNDSKRGPTVLILSPTRELATQIQDEAVKFGESSRISCTCLYGGAPKGPQLKDLDRGTNIVVATPGRLNDILEMNRVNLSQVSYLVLDEADRMLDMGFEPQLRKIVKQIPHRRQTLMFTATWPKEVRRIAADLLVNPVQINIGNVDELVANKAITQHVEVITPVEKRRRLEQILRSQDPGSKIIIFCSTKRMCDQLAHNLNQKFGAAAIHGDKSQSERDKVLSQFRTGQSPVLVATDVAARGLDIKDVRVVINYDFPTGVEDYVHRIGRTGRAGATGVAYTFFSERDSRYASDLVKILNGANQCIPSQLKDMTSHGGYGYKSRQCSSGSGAVQSKNSFSSSPNESFHERFHGGKQDDHRNMGSDWGDSYRSRSRSPIRSGQGAKW